MKIQKLYDVQKPRLEGPHGYYGQLVCREESPREQQFLAGFAENIWLKAGSEDYAVSFVPTVSLTAFWVNARTKNLVAKIIDEAAGRISNGLPNVREVSDLVK